jgi:hypothetical protein
MLRKISLWRQFSVTEMGNAPGTRQSIQSLTSIQSFEMNATLFQVGIPELYFYAKLTNDM